jgi:antitoxin component YwqK of YwqJK toxin-antitoxin module
MKSSFRYIYHLSLFAILLSCSEDVTRSYWDNGQLQSELQYNEAGELHGVARWYYETGNIQQEAHYHNNLLHGKMTRYYVSGNIESEGWYTNNLKDSVLTNYNAVGNITGIAHYINDSLHGFYATYYADGKTMIEGEYVNGLFHGIWLFYDQFGSVIGKADYNMGSGVQKAWHPNGKLSRVMHYKNNLLHGTEEHYNWTGTLELIRHFEYGHLISEENPLK